MAKVEYEPMLVSYVDVLGFGELINTKTAGEISRLLRIFNETTAPHRFKNQAKLPGLPEEDQVSFSDLVLTCTPLKGRGDRDTVFQQFTRIVHAQAILMLDEGILIRGGIAAGLATKSYRKYFGPAVITAYEWEQRKPGHPRVMVDPSVMQRLSETNRDEPYRRDDQVEVIKSFLASDDDGNCYIDYLRVALYESDDPAWVLKKHNELINRRLKLFADNPPIREKYEWLRQYHDKVAEDLKVRGRQK